VVIRAHTQADTAYQHVLKSISILFYVCNPVCALCISSKQIAALLLYWLAGWFLAGWLVCCLSHHAFHHLFQAKCFWWDVGFTQPNVMGLIKNLHVWFKAQCNFC